MVAERRRFQRRYDLTERVLPAGTDTTEPDREELGRFAVRRELSTHGVAAALEIRRANRDAKAISAAIADLAAAGEVTSVRG